MSVCSGAPHITPVEVRGIGPPDRRHYDKLEHMEEGADKQGQTPAKGAGEPHANGRAYSQEPSSSYLTLHSLMNCSLVK